MALEPVPPESRANERLREALEAVTRQPWTPIGAKAMHYIAQEALQHEHP